MKIMPTMSIYQNKKYSQPQKVSQPNFTSNPSNFNLESAYTTLGNLKFQIINNLEGKGVVNNTPFLTYTTGPYPENFNTIKLPDEVVRKQGVEFWEALLEWLDGRALRVNKNTTIQIPKFERL